MLLALLAGVGGCGSYADADPLTYEYAKALFSICNRRSDSQLQPVREQIEQARSDQKLSRREADWLIDIIEDASAGEWESALSDARKLMEDQVQGR